MDIFSGKIIMTDLDGTLLDSGSRISRRNLDAAEYFISRGGKFTVATGRSRAGMEVFAPELRVNAPAALFNGSCLWDFSSDEPLLCRGVDKTDALRLCQRVAEAVPGCGIEVHTTAGPWVVRENARTHSHFAFNRMPHRLCAAEDVPGQWVNLCILTESGLMDGLWDFVRNEFPGRFFLQLSGDHLLEVQAPGANKGWAALEICRRVGVGPEGLYAIGDGTNDVDLLAATRNAFAPSNARKEVLALNPTLLPTNDEHILEALVEIIEKESTIIV